MDIATITRDTSHSSFEKQPNPTSACDTWGSQGPEGEGESIGPEHIKQVAEAGGASVAQNRWQSLGEEAWVPLRVRGLSPPPLLGLG